MYGKWLFKEIKTEYGLCKVEIFRKNFTDTAIEIGALESNSLTLAMENLGNITDPIGKSVCSFSIIDTDQIDYDEFFTPDATAYMVVVSTKIEGGAYVTRWSGYITPDFFAENLSYRTPISISARDNIGYLNDVDFDLDASTITVRGLIEAAFNRIAEDYPMQIVFATQKQTAEGVLAIDATISTMLLREGSWYEAIETVLHDLGLQMRWVDNNTIAVLDLSQIPEYYATQAFNFVDASGYREILPAWRELAQEQDYGLRENFFEGQINNANLRFVKEETLNLPLSMGGVTGNPVMKYYAPSNWGVAGSTLTINTDNYKYIGSYGQEPSGQGGRIYFTGVQKDAANLPQNYMSYRQPVYVSQRGKMSIAFNAFNSLLATNKTSAETLQVYNPADRFMDFATGDSLQLGLKINVFLHVGTKTFILGDTWEEITGAETNSLYFTLDKVGQLGANGTTTPTEQEITIDVNTIPYNGELELRIYGFCIHEKTNLQEDAGLATYDWLKMVSYIDDVRYSYERELATGQGARTEIAPLHNVKESKSYKFGQVPVYAGGINAYAGGLYNASKNMESMLLFQRNANATNYSLLELVGREVIHFNKKNYNKLSGTIRSLAKEPLMFNRLFVRNGKRYAPFAYSLNIISNQMEITTMQEVENYVTESFSEINSAVTTGGATVSAGNNTVMQYSQDAGNTKRIYELTAATEEEKKDTWVMIDGTAFPEARKINVKDLEGLNEEQVEAYLTEKKYATQSWVKGITDDLETDIADRVLVTDFEKVDTSVKSLLEYFDNSGNANNALKLGGQLPSYYATKSALDTTNGNVVSLTQKMGTAESGISTNKTNIATLTTGLSNLTSRVSTAEGTIKGHTDAIALNANNIASNANNIASNAKSITAIQGSYVDKSSAQEINGVKTFKNGLKIGDAELVWDSTNKALKIVGSAYITKDLSFGGYQAPGGGGTSGGGIVTIKVNGQEYTSQNGIVTLPNYPSLAGYATEDYVTSRGYITNAALNGYAKLTDIPTSLPASDVYAWAKAATKPAYTASEVGALSETGGTVRGVIILSGNAVTNAPLNIATPSMGYTGYIRFGAGFDTHELGHLGFSAKGVPAMSYEGVVNSLIHSGNIGSQSVSYASSAGNADVIAKSYREDVSYAFNETKVRLIHTTGTNPGGFPNTYVGGLSAISAFGGWQIVSYGNVSYIPNPYYRAVSDTNVWGDWNQLAFLTDNVASATKLQTARTIWGQSFDGTGNVNGDLNMRYSKITFAESADDYHIGWGSSNMLVYANYFGHYFTTNGSERMRIVQNGNVLVGTTDDIGYKLDVGGNIRASAEIINDTSMSTWSAYQLRFHGGFAGLYAENWISDGDANRLWLYNAHKLALYGSLIELKNNTSLVGRLDIDFGRDATGPTDQAITINSATYASTYAGWPGIGFHIPGITYATIKFGSDTCFHFMNSALSGWVDVKVGNLTATGDITFGSDARYKNKITDVEIDLATIANAPLFIYKWNDREDDREHLGTTAQYWFDTAFKNAVIPTNDEKLWAMSYSEIAVGNTIILAREQIKVKSRVEVLEEKVKQLEDELDKYRRVA